MSRGSTVGPYLLEFYNVKLLRLIINVFRMSPRRWALY
jgi:hypothetical protein